MFTKCILISILSSHLIITSNANCLSAKNCSECISQSILCFWCEEVNYKYNYRCGSEEVLKQQSCPNHKIIGSQIRPEFTVITDQAFSKTVDQTIQLKPQKYKISLRSGSEMRFPIHFRQADDYPLDLYYLMDLSCTMKKFKRNLESVGQTLAQKMKKTTKNFRIGFGSFVDKPVIPFTSFKNEPLECGEGLDRSKGENTYSFSHKLKLKSDEMEFVERVRTASTSGNTDSPEGTLDALMQVLVCKGDIGWRDQSDKIIVVATDEDFHYAGDGKLAGILVPNDGQCHMSNNGYTHYHLLDYPSMDQIAEVVNKNKFNVVFTVTKNVESNYETLAKIIGSNARVTRLQDQNQDEIIQLIDRVYNDIRSSVELRVEPMADFLDIELYSKCGNKSTVDMKTKNCSFSGKPEIIFTVKIALKYCPNSPSLWDQKIRIGLTNINESVEIDLRLLCQCDCDQPNRVVPDSDKCNGAGTLACGICAKCNGIRTGDKCECDPDMPINLKDPESHCRQKNSTSTCNNRGNCWCGKCQCIDGYSGSYCQFDDSLCKRGNVLTQEICSGNGVCFEQKCKCNDKYSGYYCDCLKSNSSCFAPNEEQLCSGRGDCRCGKCDCIRERSTGKYCQICPSCESQEYCDTIWKCVPKICQELYGKDNCTERCAQFPYELVDKLSPTPTNSAGGSAPFTYECRNRSLDNECDLLFTYERTDSELNGEMHLKITQVLRHCAQRVNLVVVSGGLFGAVILIGLALLLIWKLITEILDRKEFTKFQRELNKAQWGQGENPLYKEVTTTFTNPTFGLREKGMKRLSRLTERFSRRFDLK